MNCGEKHTRIQVSDADFRCPKCNAESGDFYIYDGSNADCNLMHPDDFLYCTKCEYETSGKAFVAAYVRKKNLVPCPRCKGRGVISGKGRATK